MDFFEYASIVGEFTPTKLWVQLLVGGLCFAIVFIFEAIALFTIATRNGYKHKWMAFVPFFNTYYIGVCAQKNKFYNVNAKTIGLIAAITEAILVFLYIFSLISEVLIDKYLIEVEDTYLGVTISTYQLNADAVPDNLQWAAWVYNYMDAYIIRIFNIVYMVMEVILLICFFQTYACRRYILFSITSVLFPIMGILFFIVRNNKGVNYRDYVRAEQARQYQQYQQYRQQNYNNNPYNQNPYNRNPYNNPPQNGGSGADPFDEFNGSENTIGNSNGNSQNDPFDDFDK